MISVIYPINSGNNNIRTVGRLALFKNTIESIKKYSDNIKDKFEILVLDSHSTDDVRGYVINQKKHFNISYIKFKQPYHNFCECYILNLGLNLSKYNSIVLTNPEVMHISPAIIQFLELIGENILGKVEEINIDGSFKQLLMGTKEPNRHDNPGMFFLAMFNKNDILSIGGFDEDFRYGYGDNDFGWRFKTKFKFRILDEIYGIHQSHGRPLHDGNFRHNGQLWKEKQKIGQIIVNQNRIIGNTSYIIEII